MTSHKVHYQVLRAEALQHQLMIWWARLHNQQSLLQKLCGDSTPPAYPPAHRAELRRCRTVDDALLTEGFRNLWFTISESVSDNETTMLAWGVVAGALADVRQHDGSRSFAAGMGSQQEKTGKPYVSELRFAQLQKSDDLDAFMRRCRRSIALLGQSVNVTSLADGILQWAREHQNEQDSDIRHRLAVYWARDYFTALAGYQK